MVEAYFKGIRQVILNELDNATEKIVVAVYWFTNHTIFQKLVEKLDEGLKVELIIHNDYINNRETGLDFQCFIDKGGEFYFSNIYTPMHNKFCVIDNKILINGSYNWTYYAEDRNSENILVVKNEEGVIDAFAKEFDNLKLQMEKVDKVVPLTKFEVDESNLLNARDYLANDIVFQAAATGESDLVESAFLIAPENIEVQKIAFELNLTPKFRLKHSIGSSLHNDKYLIIVPKGSFVPFSNNEIVQTVSDNQTSSNATICYGENVKASQNTSITEISIYGLPPKPAGEAKMRYHFTIDIYGNLRMEKYSLDNGQKEVRIKNISYLLVPNALSEALAVTIDCIRINISRLNTIFLDVNRDKVEEFENTIIRQLNSVLDLCTSLDEANILLSEDEKYSLLNIQRLYVINDRRFIKIDKLLLELYDLLKKRFSKV